MTHENLNFGEALEALKLGKKAFRSNWNGKNMFIFLNKGAFDHERFGFNPGENPHPGHLSTIDGIRMDLFESGDKGIITRLPNINMMTASGAIVTGWLASQTDMLAVDWFVE